MLLRAFGQCHEAGLDQVLQLYAGAPAAVHVPGQAPHHRQEAANPVGDVALVSSGDAALSRKLRMV
jgi:hypothetical protein